MTSFLRFFNTSLYRTTPQYALPAAPAPAPPPPPPPPFKGLKRAVCIGINYTGTEYPLEGCANDASHMMNQLKTFFPMCKEYRLITDTTPLKPTRKNILDSIAWLVADLKPNEHVMFHYSGHGGQIRDKNGDEVTGMDDCIFPVDGTKLETISDDELRANLALRIPAGSKCFVVLDCCHSGTAVDLRCVWQAQNASSLTYTESKLYAKTPGTIVFLSGCRDTETAADTVDETDTPCGALTMALLHTWKTYGAAIKMKYILWDVRQYLKNRGYAQIPQLSSGFYMDPATVFDLSV